MGTTVALVRSGFSESEINRSVSNAWNLISFSPKRNQVESVVIKANLCYYWKSDTGYTTDPRIIAGIIDCVRERYGADTQIQVVEADASAMRTKYAFPMLGYENLAKQKKVKLFNLSNDFLKKESVLVNGHEFTFEVSQSLLDCDLFINVPKLKLMRATRITCALKNIFGCIASPNKFVYHSSLDRAIVGINKILHPDLTIVDGLVALGRFPVKLGLIMASIDPFSIDWIASQIMGYRPSKVGFLKVAIKEKLGNPKGITTCGEDLAPFRKKFPRESFLFQKWLWDVQFGLLKLYGKIVKDVIPPSLEGI